MCASSTGVGTATTMKSASLSAAASVVGCSVHGRLQFARRSPRRSDRRGAGRPRPSRPTGRIRWSVLLAELDGQRQADVAQSNHGQSSHCFRTPEFLRCWRFDTAQNCRRWCCRTGLVCPELSRCRSFSERDNVPPKRVSNTAVRARPYTNTSTGGGWLRKRCGLAVKP